MRPQQDIRSRLMTTFKAEAEEHLEAIAEHLAALDRGLPAGQVPPTVEALFRAVHTLKGAARSVALADVEALCQGLESLLSRLKQGHISMSRDVLGRLQETADAVARLLTEGAPRRPEAVPGVLGAEETPPERRKALAPDPAGPSLGRTIRIETAKLDAFQNRAEDLLSLKLAAEERVGEARRLAEGLARCREQTSRSIGRPVTGKAPVPHIAWTDGLAADVRTSELQARALLGRLQGDRRTVSGVVDGLQEEVREIRMVAAATILDTLPRMLGELARSRGKEVDFDPQGADLEVDRKVLEAIKDPLLHLTRNALDHGIEKPEVRENAGKPPRGRIRVTFAPLEGRRIEVCVEDDGAGIDIAAVRAGATRARLLSAEEAAALPEDAALDLIFSSGVSTSPVVSDLSGHGLGMAIVRDRVEHLGGQILVETRAGKGTTVRMHLPATLVTFRGLLVRCGRQAFLFPIEAVERALRVDPKDVENVAGAQAIRWEGSALPFAPLGALLGLARTESDEPASRSPCILLASAEGRGAFLVDELLGEREVLLKTLRPPLVRIRHVAGGGLLGSGELALILRPADLLRAMRQSLPAQLPQGLEEDVSAATILVVDDSITTRTMESNLLEAAGYKVRVAADGQEALTALKTERFNLVISDVDMPRMNGFELTTRIRADPRLADIPVILVTALEAREDKERGVEAGANAYVIKSSFDQSRLLEIIRRFI
jgi:two-component system chemotaxis sensor kinase CheA